MPVAKWAVIRVLAEDGMAAQATLARAFAPITMSIDPHPPAAGPEWEIAVQDRSEDRVVKLLGAIGIRVLAAKTELRPTLVRPTLSAESP
jgi:hypothetical protein